MKAFARLLALATWVGLLSGLAELVLRGIEKFALHRYIYLSRQIVWMTPLADVILCVGVIAVVGLASAALRRSPSYRTGLVALALVFAMSLLSMQPWMAGWAMVIVAIGFARMIWQVAGSNEERAMRLAGRTTPVLLAVIVLLTLWADVRPMSAERAAARVPAPPPGSPNVIMVVWDAVRAQELSLYGYGRATSPHLDSLASRAVVFDHAFSNGPYTLPGHAGFLTGHWWDELRSGWVTPLDPDVPTLAAVLSTHGWRTGAFSANHLFVTWEHGLLRGFTHAEDYVVSPGEIARSSALLKWILSFDPLRRVIGWYDLPGRRSASDIREAFLRWQGRDPSRPFFAFLNVFDAHDPYLPPAPFDTMFGFPPGGGSAERRRSKARAIADAYTFSPAEVARLRDSYDDAIAEADHDFSLLLADLRSRGLLQNTLVILLGDHGEEFKEHGAFGHGADIYLPAVHVPLLLKYPEAGDGKRVSVPVSLRDLPATILDFLHVDTAGTGIPGRGLERFLSGASPMAAETLLTEVDRMPRNRLPKHAPVRVPLHSIIVWPYQLITGGTKAELYDIASDTAQQHDLANDPAHAPTRDSLVAALARWRRHAVSAKP